jgi:hypothetical protein
MNIGKYVSINSDSSLKSLISTTNFKSSSRLSSLTNNDKKFIDLFLNARFSSIFCSYSLESLLKVLKNLDNNLRTLSLFFNRNFH